MKVTLIDYTMVEGVYKTPLTTTEDDVLDAALLTFEDSHDCKFIPQKLNSTVSKNGLYWNITLAARFPTERTEEEAAATVSEHVIDDEFMPVHVFGGPRLFELGNWDHLSPKRQ